MAIETLAPKGFRTVDDVIGIQNRILRLISGGVHTSSGVRKGTLADRIKQKEIEQLELLQHEALDKERAFYASIGCASSGYLGLYNKALQWKRTGAARILQNPELIDEIQAVFDEISKADLDAIVSEFASLYLTKKDLQSLFYEDKELDAIYDSIIDDVVTKAGRKSSTGNRKGTLAITFKVNKASEKKKFTFLKTRGVTLFQSGRKDKDGNSIIEFHFTNDMPQSVRDKLVAKLLDIAKKQGSQIQLSSVKDINREISERILRHLPSGRYARARDVIASTTMQFLIQQQKIKTGQNSSVIRGMLGEVYWTAFFEFLGLNATPVGFDVQSQQGWEIPIDVAFKHIGFQVKNYTAKDGVVTFNQHLDRELHEMVPNSIPLNRFFGNHLGLGTEGVQAFGNYFFSYEYNKRNLEKDTEGDYIPVEKRFEAINGGIKTYVESSIRRTIELEREAVLKDPELFDKELEPGKPVFFFINNKPFPTSAIIGRIIEELRGLDDIVIIKTSNVFLNLYGTGGGFMVEKKWDQSPGPVGVFERMKDARIEYTVDVNVNRLLTKIINEAGKTKN